MLATDTEIACLGAHDGGDGGIVIVGTGSCAEAHIEGRTLRLGGWGFDLSDQGSGATIGRSALRQSLLAHDGLDVKSALSAAVLAEFGGDPNAMVIWAESARPRDYARFSPMVLSHATGGDGVATSIVRKAAAAVDQLVIALHDAGAGPIAVLGGLADSLLPWLGDEARRYLVEPKGTALDGATLLARRLLTEDKPDAA
jgi:glucosamine kinase